MERWSRVGRFVAASACALLACGAHAVSSSVRLEGLSFSVVDLLPDDGIAPAVVQDPTFTFYDATQELDVTSSMPFDFIAQRCPVCPVVDGASEIVRNDDLGLAGRTLGPGSTYVDQRLVGEVVVITPGTRVTVSATATFNEGLASPIGHAALQLAMVGYALFPDHYDAGLQLSERVVFDAPGQATVELSFDNTGAALAPLHYAYIMGVDGHAPPIPEPESALLTALGIAFVAWRTRRR
jgi:hypothetical protein